MTSKGGNQVEDPQPYGVSDEFARAIGLAMLYLNRCELPARVVTPAKTLVYKDRQIRYSNGGLSNPLPLGQVCSELNVKSKDLSSIESELAGTAAALLRRKGRHVKGELWEMLHGEIPNNPCRKREIGEEIARINEAMEKLEPYLDGPTVSPKVIGELLEDDWVSTSLPEAAG